MDILVRHRRRFTVDPAGAGGWAAVLEHLGHRVHLGPDGRHAAVDSALHGRTLALRVTAASPHPHPSAAAPAAASAGPAPAVIGHAGARDRLLALLAATLRESGAAVWLEEPAAAGHSGGAVVPPAGRPEGRPGMAVDILIHVALDDVTLRAWLTTAGCPPWAAWRLGRHLARALWRAGCVPVRQRHRPAARPPRTLGRPLPAEEAAGGRGDRAAAGRDDRAAPGCDGPAAARPPEAAPPAAWAPDAAEDPGHGPRAVAGAAAPATARVLVPRLAATLRLPAAWPAEAVATAIYQGLVTFFGGPADALVPPTDPAPAADDPGGTVRATAGDRPGSAGQDPPQHAAPRQDPAADGDPVPPGSDAGADAAPQEAQQARDATPPPPATPGRSTPAGSDASAADGSGPPSEPGGDPSSWAAARPQGEAAAEAPAPASPQGSPATAGAGASRHRASRSRPVAVPAHLPAAAMPPGAASGHVFAAPRPTGGAPGRPAPPPTARPWTSSTGPGSSVTGRPRPRPVPSFAVGRPPGSLQPFR